MSSGWRWAIWVVVSAGWLTIVGGLGAWGATGALNCCGPTGNQLFVGSTMVGVGFGVPVLFLLIHRFLRRRTWNVVGGAVAMTVLSGSMAYWYFP